MITRMTRQEKNFWNKFKKQSLDDIEFLIKNNKDISALRNILCMIDALAGFFTGRKDKGVEKSWFSYIDRVMKRVKNLNIKGSNLYFPNLKIYSYHRRERNTGSRKKQNIENCCALLYSIYRTGVIHDGMLPVSFFITKTNNNVWIIRKGDKQYKIGIDVVRLSDALRDSIERYEKSFESDPKRIKNFRKRFQFLKGKYIFRKTSPIKFNSKKSEKN